MQTEELKEILKKYDYLVIKDINNGSTKIELNNRWVGYVDEEERYAFEVWSNGIELKHFSLLTKALSEYAATPLEERFFYDEDEDCFEEDERTALRHLKEDEAYDEYLDRKLGI